MKTVAIALALRILIAVSTCTFFQPDEFFQSLEVAHHAVFGYGHLTWEWVASPPIRSPFYPALFMPIYWLLKVTGLEGTNAMIIGPKILQAAIATIADISTAQLAARVLGPRYKDAALILFGFSLFNVLALTRTLSNSAETSLVAAGMCFWTESGQSRRNLRVWLILAALGCLIRPTSAIIWIIPFIKLFSRAPNKPSVALDAFLIAIPALAINIAVDSLYYGRLTFTPLNFIRTNLSPISSFYGHSPWHYYLTQGIPVLLNTALPLYVASTLRMFREERTVGTKTLWDIQHTIVFTTLVYSLLGHKEWRFLHPLLPLMQVIATRPLVDGFRITSRIQLKKRKGWSTLAICLILASQIPAWYLIAWHGRAQIDVMHYLRSLHQSDLRSVGFLVPCHSTPWQAYLHRRELEGGRMWALGCEPPLNVTILSTYRDQGDVFYESPISYLRQNFPASVDATFPPSLYPSTAPGQPPPPNDVWEHTWPSHLVFFGALIQQPEGEEIARFFRELGYSMIWRSGNGFEEDPRRRGGIEVWRWLAADKIMLSS